MPSERAMKAAERLEEIVTFPRLREGVAEMIDSAAGIPELEARLVTLEVRATGLDRTLDLAIEARRRVYDERDALRKRLDAVIAEADNYTDGAPDRDASANLAYRIIRLARGEE